MNFDAKYKIEAVVCQDVTRAHITNVELDVDGKRLMATNGHCGAIVPASVDASDRPGAITPEAISRARRSAKKRGDVVKIAARKRLLSVGDKTEAMYRRPDGYTYPPMDQVFQGVGRYGEKDTVSITLNPRLLTMVAEAIGADGKYGRSLVTLTFNRRSFENAKHESVDAVFVSAANSDGYGILMPGRR